MYTTLFGPLSETTFRKFVRNYNFEAIRWIAMSLFFLLKLTLTTLLLKSRGVSAEGICHNQIIDILCIGYNLGLSFASWRRYGFRLKQKPQSCDCKIKGGKR